MNATATLEKSKSSSFTEMARSYEAVLQLPVNQHPEARYLIAQLSEAERQNRVNYKTQFYLKLSKLRYAGSLEENSYSASRNPAKEQILQW